jgi:hypothetical protein
MMLSHSDPFWEQGKTQSRLIETVNRIAAEQLWLWIAALDMIPRKILQISLYQHFQNKSTSYPFIFSASKIVMLITFSIQCHV